VNPVVLWYYLHIDGILGLRILFIIKKATRMSGLINAICTEEVSYSQLMELLAEAGMPSQPYITPAHL
jgi:hypothetical protein